MCSSKSLEKEDTILNNQKQMKEAQEVSRNKTEELIRQVHKTYSAISSFFVRTCVVHKE